MLGKLDALVDISEHCKMLLIFPSIVKRCLHVFLQFCVTLKLSIKDLGLLLNHTANRWKPRIPEIPKGFLHVYIPVAEPYSVFINNVPFIFYIQCTLYSTDQVNRQTGSTN